MLPAQHYASNRSSSGVQFVLSDPACNICRLWASSVLHDAPKYLMLLIVSVIDASWSCTTKQMRGFPMKLHNVPPLPGLRLFLHANCERSVSIFSFEVLARNAVYGSALQTVR